MTDEEFFVWYNVKASADEKKICERIGYFEKFFTDMKFDRDSISGKMILCESKPSESDIWIDDFAESCVPEEISYFHPNVQIIVADLDKNISGSYDFSNNILTISTGSIDDDSVILHEMIHIYEGEINKQPLFYHDALLWALYSSLKRRIEDLDSLVSNHAHVLNEYSIYENGGLHDILFLLKSFDLDIKMNYPLGTVFGYGYLEGLKEYSYT